MSGTAEDEAAIRAQVTAYANAYTARDAAALAAIVTEDYESVAPDGRRISGRAGVQEMVAEEMAMMPADVAMTVTATTDFLRWLSADAAVAGGTWSAMGAPAGMGPDRGAWLSVFVRDSDGQWRESNGMSAPYMPPPAPPAATTP
ncbi:MAG: SgcJ/EcaC family oxidoreductase [Gemmatimonadales bacterium]